MYLDDLEACEDVDYLKLIGGAAGLAGHAIHAQLSFSAFVADSVGDPAGVFCLSIGVDDMGGNEWLVKRRLTFDRAMSGFAWLRGGPASRTRRCFIHPCTRLVTRS